MTIKRGGGAFDLFEDVRRRGGPDVGFRIVVVMIDIFGDGGD